MHSHFVGRKPELARIASLLARSAAGQGGLASIVGEAGIGKTRVLTETAVLAESRGFRVVWSQVIEDSVAAPFLPWRLALREFALHDDPAVLASTLGSGVTDVADIVPELRDRLGLPAVARTAEAGAARFQLFDSVSRFLLASARRQPIVLLLDNAHLADRSSLQLLQYYCRQIVQSPTLVLVSYRPDAVTREHPLRETLAQCSRAARFEEIALGGLDRNETADLMRAITGSNVPGALVDAVCERGDGNPLFVSQVTASIARRVGAASGAIADLAIEIPANLQEAISARLAGLDAATLDALRTAAILGRDFDSMLLTALAGQPPFALLALLEAAVGAGVLTPLGPGRYRFVHALFREALYGVHPLVQRVELHQQAAHRIEERYASELEAWVPQLAYHWFEASRAGYQPRAVECCRMAARQALASRAYVEARMQLEHALAVAEMAHDPDPHLRFELLMDLGDAQFRSGQSEPAAKTYLRAAVLAERQHWWSQLSTAVLALQHVQGQLGIIHVASIPLHSLALEQLPADAGAMRARLLASLASACRRAEDRQRGLDAFEESVRIARSLDDPGVLFECLSQALLVLQPPEDAPRQVALQREALALAERSGKPEAALEASSAMLFSLSKLGDYDELESVLQRLHARADAARHPHYRQVAAGFEAQIAILRGRWADAVRWARASLQQAGLDGSVGVEGRYGFQMFAIQRALGNLESIAPLFARVANEQDNTRLWLPGAILLHCELGQAEAARRLLDRLGDADKMPRDDLYTASLVYLADACIILNDAARAERLLQALQPFRALNLSVLGTVALGSGAGYMAALAAMLKRGREARVLFEEALAFNSRLRAPPLVARTQLDYAALLARSDKPADLERAGRLSRDALAIAERFGMRKLAERAKQLLASEAPAETLTERELEILQRIAEGASNKRIAMDLQISVTTVATHIRSVLRKTGTANRTEAAAHARRQNLLGNNREGDSR